MATRFYPIPYTLPHRVVGYPPAVWQYGPTPQVHRYDAWHKRLSLTKTASAQFAKVVRCDRQPNYDISSGASFMSWPLTAQTISGTFDLCLRVQARWFSTLAPSNATTVRYRVYIYIAQGASQTLRHTLLDYVDTVDFPGTSGAVWRQFAGGQALPAGDAFDGDCLVVQVGFRIVSAPSPSQTYPPDEYTRIDWTGWGATSAFTDAVNGDTSASRAPWMEFSQTLTFQPDSAAPATGTTCATAIPIASFPYASPEIDTTQAPGTEREMFFTFTAPTTGEVLITTYGTTYDVDLVVLQGTCGALTGAPYGASNGMFGANLSASVATLDAVAGTQYWIRVRNSPGAAFETNGGGLLRVTANYRMTTQEEDDLYLPAGTVAVFRDGVLVGVNPALQDYEPLGIAIDYTRRPLVNYGGGAGGDPSVGERLYVGLINVPSLIDIIDLPTVGWTRFGWTDIDAIAEPWDLPVPGPVTKGCGLVQVHLTRAGRVVALFFGNGFLYVAEEGGSAVVAFLNVVASDPEFSAVKAIDGVQADHQPGAPFADTPYYPTIENITNPQGDVITTAAGDDILYYISAGESGVPIGFAAQTFDPADLARTIRTFNLSTGVQGPDFATITPLDLGAFGLCVLPDGGLLLCNGPVVQRYTAAGSLSGTYTPSYPPGARQMADVRVTADGHAAWTVDEWTATLFKFDLATMTELASYPTYMRGAQIYQIALYQPNGVTPGPSDCPGDRGDPRVDGLPYLPPPAAPAPSTVLVADLVDAPEGLVRTTGIVPASNAYTILGWFYVSGIPPTDFTTFFYVGNDPALYTEGVWIGQNPTTGDLVGYLNAGGTDDVQAAGLTVPGWYHLAYTRNGTAHTVYVNAVAYCALTQDQSAQTHTHVLVGTDTFAADWNPHYLVYVREWASALSPAQIAANMLSSIPVGPAPWTDTPLTGDLLDVSGNGHDWSASGGVIDFVSVAGPIAPCTGTRRTARTGT